MTKTEKESILDNYIGFSNLLRTWLTTYGIGFFVFVASQQDIVSALSDNKAKATYILGCMIVALSLQVIAAFIYKYSMAYVHEGYGKREVKEKWWYRLAYFFYSSYIIEIIIDAGTIALYLIGTYTLIALMVGLA